MKKTPAFLLSAFAVLAFSLPSLAVRLVPIGDTKSAEDVELGDHVSNQIYREFLDKNKIWKDADIEAEYESGDGNFSIKGRYGRRVYDEHRSDKHVGEYYTGSEQDVSKYRVLNTLNIRASYGDDYKIFDWIGEKVPFRGQADYGFSFSVSTKELPGSVVDAALAAGYTDRHVRIEGGKKAEKTISRLLNKKECKTACKIGERVNSFAKGTWLMFVGSLEGAIRFFGKFFIDDEDDKTYMKSPLGALKLHSVYGLPMDVTAFYSNDPRLDIGDVVKHSAYATLSPARLGLEVNDLDSDAGAFCRFLEEVSFQKEPANNLLLQIKFIKSCGTSLTLFEFRPDVKIGPWRLSYNVHDWNREKFNMVTHTFAYRADLNTEKSRKAVSDIINSNYLVDFIDITKERHQTERDGLELVHYFSQDSDKEDFEHSFKIPGVTKFEEIKIASTNEQYVFDGENGRYIYDGEMLYDKEIERGNFFGKLINAIVNQKWAEVDKQVRARLYMISSARDESVKVEEANQQREMMAIFEKRYRNKFGHKRELLDIIELDRLVTGDSALSRFKHSANAMSGEDNRLEYNVILSFNMQHLQNILDADEDFIWTEAGRMFLGEEGAAAWANKASRKAWKKKYTKFDGECFENWPTSFKHQVGRKISIRKIRGCDGFASAYSWTKNIIKKRNKANEKKNPKERMKKLIRTANRTEMASHLQMLMRVVAEAPEGTIPVRFLSELIAPSLLPTKIVNDNGELFEFPYNLALDIIPDIEHLEHSKGRIGSVEMSVDIDSSPAAPDYYLEFESKKEFRGPEGLPMTVKFQIRDFVPVLADKEFTAAIVAQMSEPDSAGDKILYTVKLTDTEAAKVALSKLKPGKLYSVIMNVVNSDGLWVSEQKQLQIKPIRVSTDDSENDSKRRN